MSTTAATAAYLAGLIDGDGYVGIRRRNPTAKNNCISPKFSPCVGVYMTDEAPIKALAKFVDGHDRRVTVRKRTGAHRSLFEIGFENERAAGLLRSTFRFLVGKRRQAELALELACLREESGAHRTKVLDRLIESGPQAGRIHRSMCLGDAFVAKCAALHEAALHGSPRSGQGAGFKGGKVPPRVASAPLLPTTTADIGAWSRTEFLAYVAGLIDGEGCIGVRRRRATIANRSKTPTYTLNVSIEMTDEAPVRAAASCFGLDHLVRVRRRALVKPIFVLTIAGQRAADLLQEIEPFLIGKPEQARVALEFWAHRQTSRSHRTKVMSTHTFKAGRNGGGTYRMFGLADEFIAQCDAFYQQLRKRPNQRSRWEGHV